MTITVTQEDIDKANVFRLQRINGEKDYTNVPTTCPVALACQRVFNQEVSVGLDSVTVGDRGYMLPPRAVTFVKKYDMDMNGVTPFEFNFVSYS